MSAMQRCFSHLMSYLTPSVMNSHVVDCPSAICAARCFPVHIRNISVLQRKSMFTKYITNLGTLKSILQSVVLTKYGTKYGTLQRMVQSMVLYKVCNAFMLQQHIYVAWPSNHLVLVSSCQVSALPLLLSVSYCL